VTSVDMAPLAERTGRFHCSVPAPVRGSGCHAASGKTLAYSSGGKHLLTTSAALRRHDVARAR